MTPVIELVGWFRKLSSRHRDNQHWHAYYALPVFYGFAITYGLIRLLISIFPNMGFEANGYHIHHYTYGIIVLLIFGYVSLWTTSERMKYVCALAHGVGAAFIIDEAWMWFTLTDRYVKDYDLIFYVGALLVTIVFLPLLFDGKKEEPPRS